MRRGASSRPEKAVVLGAGAAYWIKLGEILEREYGWSIHYWSCGEALKPLFAARWPDAIVNSEIDEVLMQGESHREFSRLFRVDGSIMQALAGAKDIAMAMMDRMDATGRSFLPSQRRRHFRRLVEYWGSVYGELRPDVVLFDISPHLVYDYVAYEVAKLIGVRTIMFERSGLPGHLFAVERFEDGSQALRQAYADKLADDSWSLSESAETYWNSSRGVEGQSTPPLFKAKFARLGLSGDVHKGVGYPSLRAVLTREWRQLRHLHRRNGWGGQDIYMVTPRSYADEDRITLREVAGARFAGLRKRARLRRKYAEMSSRELPAASDGPFVFLALHYQPERATLPLGGAFSDQILMASLVSRCLPEGWTLLVKEHPLQLHPYSKGHLQRDESFYNDLNALENTRLLHPDANTEALLELSTCVATISGSVGWQALTRGKPALVFGAAWYRFCQGVFDIQSANDLQEAFSQIQKGEPVPPRATRAYLAAILEVSSVAFVEPKAEGQGRVDDQANAEAMADAIFRLTNPAGTGAMMSTPVPLTTAEMQP